MDKYKCNICGKNHSIYFGFESLESETILEIPESERKNRVIKVGNLSVVDNQLIIVRGNLFVKCNELEETYLYFDVWVKIKTEDFQKKIEEYEKDKVNYDPTLIGKLESQLILYDDTKNIEVEVTNYEHDKVDTLVKVLKKNHQLEIDQRNGISNERLIELMEKIHHRRKIENSSSKPIEELFNEIFEKALSGYIMKDKLFYINVVKDSMTLFQIISNNLLETGKVKESGFGLHLPFDNSENNELEKFKRIDNISDFDFMILDEIPTYQINLERDKKKLLQLIKLISKEVYEEEEVWFDIEEI